MDTKYISFQYGYSVLCMYEYSIRHNVCMEYGYGYIIIRAFLHEIITHTLTPAPCKELIPVSLYIGENGGRGRGTPVITIN